MAFSSSEKDVHMDLADIWLDFELNGQTVELDELDLMIIECRNRARKCRDNLDAGSDDHHNVQVQMQRSIDEARRVLGTMKPLGKKQFCVFCRNNKEEPAVYNTHVIKNERGEVICPILEKFICPKCGATGPKAHTVKYCPLGDYISTVDCVLRTPRNSTRLRTSPVGRPTPAPRSSSDSQSSAPSSLPRSAGRTAFHCSQVPTVNPCSTPSPTARGIYGASKSLLTGSR
ncbi:nanos homolog 2 [Aplysia californica]|uniref:Nanos homolog 2 n=1 Tax=Aplysia californica TaxID=6500 RepID=A0ABM0ZZA8_APLCA|nr:nanos homolog 2 [Aplysia californica]